MELTKKDRLILFNQYEILKLLSADDTEAVKHYDALQDIMFSGYKQDYDMLVEHFSEDVPESITRMVWDVLQMYRMLNNSYSSLTPQEQEDIDERHLIFRGFDGNDEIDHYSYCNFVLLKLNRYEEFTEGGQRDFNTHSATISRYERMLQKWNAVGIERYSLLTREQMLDIISA